MANSYSRPLLLSQLLALGLVSSASANLVFEATMDDLSPTGATATTFEYNNLPSVTTELTDTSPFGGGSYLSTSSTADLVANGNNVGGVTFTPTSDATSWKSMQTLAPTGFNTLNGGFDFFLHVTSPGASGFIGNWTRPLDFYNDTGAGGMRLNLYGNDDNTIQVEFLSATDGLLAGGTTATTAVIMTGDIAGGFQLDTTYHIGLTFATDQNGLVTSKLFLEEGTGAIDTTGSSAGSTTFKIDGSIVTTGFANKSWSSIIGGRAPYGDGDLTGRSIQADTYRLYDDTPTTFGAVPEPSAFALILGSAIAGVVFIRRRRS